MNHITLFNVPVLFYFGATLVFYHVSEILLVLCIEPEEFELPASLLFSRPYILAMCFAVAEYVLESVLFSSNKRVLSHVVSFPGLVLVVVGEAIRKTAWVTARRAFTHRIKTEQRVEHVLITSGVYGVCRHPGYLGWILWAVGTQFLLANPFSIVLFAAVSWKFFRERIPYEEMHMERFFGTDYDEYRNSVPTLLPGIP